MKRNLRNAIEAAKRMRVVLRIGGSVIASPVNPKLISEYGKLLKELKAEGHEVTVVIGGGQLAREFIGIARDLGLDEEAQDEIAISVSRVFAQLFLRKLGGIGCATVALTVEDAAKCLENGKVAVMGGLRPGMTTDGVAALVAERANAELLVKATDQEGIYDKDPRMHKDAVKLDHLRFAELSQVFAQDRHEAGIHQIIDPEAVRILMECRAKVIVVNGFKPENVLSAINGCRVGTLID